MTNDLVWANERERKALEDENGGFLSAYIAITKRATKAMTQRKES